MTPQPKLQNIWMNWRPYLKMMIKNPSTCTRYMMFSRVNALINYLLNIKLKDWLLPPYFINWSKWPFSILPSINIPPGTMTCRKVKGCLLSFEKWSRIDWRLIIYMIVNRFLFIAKTKQENRPTNQGVLLPMILCCQKRQNHGGNWKGFWSQRPWYKLGFKVYFCHSVMEKVFFQLIFTA